MSGTSEAEGIASLVELCRLAAAAMTMMHDDDMF
jgi:hypothetical protein